MRMSSDDKDPGYEAWQKAGSRATVFLDDVEQKDVCMADEKEGIVRRCKHDADGKIYAIGDEVAMEEVRGVVRIEIPAA